MNNVVIRDQELQLAAREICTMSGQEIPVWPQWRKVNLSSRNICCSIENGRRERSLQCVRNLESFRLGLCWVRVRGAWGRYNAGVEGRLLAGEGALAWVGWVDSVVRLCVLLPRDLRGGGYHGTDMASRSDCGRQILNRSSSGRDPAEAMWLQFYVYKYATLEHLLLVSIPAERSGSYRPFEESTVLSPAVQYWHGTVQYSSKVPVSSNTVELPVTQVDVCEL